MTKQTSLPTKQIVQQLCLTSISSGGMPSSLHNTKSDVHNNNRRNKKRQGKDSYFGHLSVSIGGGVGKIGTL